MALKVSETQINKVLLGDTDVIRMYSSEDLVFGAAPVPGSNWTYEQYANDVPVGTQVSKIPDEGTYSFAVSDDNKTAALTLKNVNNTEGADETVDLVINSSNIITDYTLKLGEGLEYFMLTDTDGIRYSYPSAYTIRVDKNPCSVWTFSSRTNGLISFESSAICANGKDKIYSALYGDYSSSLTVHSVDNTSQATQIVTLKVNDEIKLDHAEWTFGTVSEEYDWYLNGSTQYKIQWGYNVDKVIFSNTIS